MTRSPVTLRDAVGDDAPLLLSLWEDTVRRADPQEQLAELELIVKEAAESAEQRIVVAEYDGSPAGAVYLKVATLSPLNREPALLILNPTVVPELRRKGIGHALMDAAVSQAEELGIGHLVTAAATSSRDANRYMSRLGLGPQATMRMATTHVVRSKLMAQLPASQRTTGRAQLLAARRSMRRARPAR